MKTLRNYTHINATTLDEAVTALGGDNAWVNAGGTDIVGTMRFECLPDEMYPKTLVNIKTIPGLDYITVDGGTLKIGALTRLEDIAKSSDVHDGWAALAEAAHKTASPHLREAGTLGGNICQFNRCWYFRKPDNRFFCVRKGGGMCFATAGENRYHSIFGGILACVAVNPSDTAPALVALDANIVTTKRDIAAEEFWDFAVPGSTILDADEIVTEIQVPAFSGKSAFVKFRLRSEIDFPIVNCAAAVSDGAWKICLNAVFNKPYRATAAEDFMAGKTIDVDNAETAGAAAVSGNLALSLNRYKIQIAKAMVKKAILACA